MANGYSDPSGPKSIATSVRTWSARSVRTLERRSCDTAECRPSGPRRNLTTGSTTSRSRLLILGPAGLFLVIHILIFLPPVGQSQPATKTRQSDIAAIDSYTKRLDQFIKRNPKKARIFANVASATTDEPDRWREFKSDAQREKADTGENLNENAYVWLKDGKIVAANFTFQSPSRDWAHFVMYYFREDGSLAKIQAQLNTFYGDMTVIRDRFFDSNGKLLRSTTKHLDLHSQKPKQRDTVFNDEPIPIFRNPAALPFHKLL